MKFFHELLPVLTAHQQYFPRKSPTKLKAAYTRGTSDGDTVDLHLDLTS